MKTTMRLGQRGWDEWMMKIDAREVVRSGVMLILIIVVLAFERALGVPSWSALLIAYLCAQMNWPERGVWLGVMAIVLGVLYSLSFATALLLSSVVVALYLYLPLAVRSESVRLFAASFVMAIGIGWLTDLDRSLWSLFVELVKIIVGVLTARWLILGSTTQRGLSVSKRLHFLGLFREQGRLL